MIAPPFDRQQRRSGEGWWVVKGGGGGSVVEWEGGVEKKIPFLGCDLWFATGVISFYMSVSQLCNCK